MTSRPDATARTSARQSTARQAATARTDRSAASGAGTSRSEKLERFLSEAVREAYDVYCWGFGGQGALGNGAFRDELAPYLVQELRESGGALLVSAGHNHTVAVCGDMRARGWGRSHEGQLGLELEDQLETPQGGRSVPHPSLLGLCRNDPAATIQAIGAGAMHTGVLTQPRSAMQIPEVYMFGRGEEGQLGGVQPSEGLRPSECELSAADQAALASVGLGLATRGAEDAKRPLGGERPTAVALPSTVTPLTVVCGGLHSAVVGEQGQLFTWGDGSFGQTGQGTREAIRAPRRLPSLAWEGQPEKEAPRRLTISTEESGEGGKVFHVKGQRGPPLQVSCLSCGQYHTAAATIEGACFAWGANSDGQLGLGDLLDRGSPHLCRAVSEVLQVACGGRHTLVLLQDGSGWSCGSNALGQLGRRGSGSDIESNLGTVEGLSSVSIVQVACGGAHCAAVTNTGSCYTWGKNQNGQLGHGYACPSGAPKMVEDLQQAVWVACGGAHTVAMCQLPGQPY